MELIGKRIGYLVVESFYNTKKTKGGSAKLWLLRCDCGGSTVLCTADINRAKAKSCGCKRYEFISNALQDNIVGNVYGRLTVIERTDKQTAGGTYFYKCKCECGNEKIINGGSLRQGHTKSCGCLKIEMNMKRYENGKRNGYYHQKRLNSDNQKEHKEWRKGVYERDNYTCQECGLTSIGGLCAHHIKEWSIFPELRSDISNGLTLCRSCHSKYHTLGFKKEQLLQSNFTLN